MLPVSARRRREKDLAHEFFKRAKNADGMEFAQRLSRRAARPVDCGNVLGIKSFIFHRDTTLINMQVFQTFKINILSVY